INGGVSHSQNTIYLSAEVDKQPDGNSSDILWASTSKAIRVQRTNKLPFLSF
ncbi:hypothetical protein J6590_079513, partial [Homalodisca vitripennis]